MARSASGAGADNDVADLEQSLGELGLQQYLARFLKAGFSTWETLADISEDDLAALNVRLGHRRKLQREIARRRRSWPDYRPLPIPSHMIQSLPTPPTSTLGSIRESVEVNFYSLANKTHSISQWSQETSQAYGASNGTRTLSDGYGMRLRVIDLLQAGDADFSSAGRPESPLYGYHQEHVLRILQDLETSGIQVQWTTNNHTGLKEQWLHEVCRTIFLKHDQASCQKIQSDPEVDSSGVNVVEVYFEQFLTKLNHFLFLFSESQLRQSFDPKDHRPDEDFPVHIYLVLALGAKYSGFQAEKLCNQWYMKARLRLLHDDLQDDLEMMRLLTMLCIFKVSDNVDYSSSSHFLDLALDIGLAYGLDAEFDLPLRDMEDPNRSQWLRVWETIRFLTVWFLLQYRDSPRSLQGLAPFLDIEQPPLSSEESYNSRLVHMSMTAVSSILKEVIKDRPGPSTHSPLLYKAHLGALDSWRSNLPLYLCLRPPDSADPRVVYPGGNDRQKTAVLNVQSLFLGTVCELLRPALIAVLKSASVPGSKELEPFAHRCVQAARNIIELCIEMADSGYPISSTWIAQHFLFKAAVIMVLDSTRTSSNLKLCQARLAYIRTAEKLLKSGSGISKHNPHVIVLRLLCRSVGIDEDTKDASGRPN